ncbi:hypothetical protein HXA35_15580 [Bacillus sp. A301a_S52]|jgi:hypothetical protein|nr:hypothetical protein [Bacillus sp. A301a_S52]
MKTTLFTLSIILLLFASAFDDPNSNLSNSVEVLDSGKTITFEDDGRVSPIPNTDELDETELDQILTLIGYDESYIQNMPLKIKELYASYGGKRVDGEISDFTHTYVSGDESYEVTPHNKEEIREKQIEDLQEYNLSENDINSYNLVDSGNVLSNSNCDSGTPQGVCSDGIWNARMNAVKVGDRGAQAEYMISMNFEWEETPNMTFTDKAGMHWGSYGQPIAGSSYGEIAYYDTSAGEYHYDSLSLDVGSNYGIGTSFKFWDPLVYRSDRQGYFHDIIRISKSDHQFDSLSVSGRYVHPWTPGISLSIARGGISLSGDIGLSDDWSWRYNFTVE